MDFKSREMSPQIRERLSPLPSRGINARHLFSPQALSRGAYMAWKRKNLR